MPPAEAQGVDSANSLFYKKVRSNISHGFTYSILLSTIRQADGFETTDCLECLQILNILIYGRRVCCKAGDWTLCTILGYGLPERETCCILPVNQLSRAYFLTKWKKCNIVSLFLQIHIVESTIHHSLMRMDSRQRIVSNACTSLIS